MPDHPNRSVRLEGASNFRDLGGYRAADGRTVRWRRLFRSDHLAQLLAQDIHTVSQLNIGRTFDLRSPSERSIAPYRLSGVQQIELSIEPLVVRHILKMGQGDATLTAEQAVDWMQSTYREFVLAHSDTFAKLFQHLLQSPTPSVIHCTAGKDRTGFAAALFLLALNVPIHTVRQDYLLTNKLYRMPSFEGSQTPKDVLDVLWLVQPCFLDTALQMAKMIYGSMDQYLNVALSLGPAARRRLADLYLDEPS